MEKKRLNLEGYRRHFYAYKLVDVLGFALALVLLLEAMGVKLGASLIEAIGYPFLGLFIWSFLEYGIHRYFFHAKPKNKKLKELVNLSHLYHHQDPDDSRVWNNSSWFIAPWIVLLISILYLIVRDYKIVSLLMAGMVLGYCGYEYFHRKIHSKAPGFKYWQDNHHQHHNVSWGSNYGVTTPLWDHIFKTYRK